MKFLVSGSAGRVGYADGQHFIYTDVEREPREWLSTGIGKYAYAMLHAQDMMEIEAETLEEAIERGREEVNYLMSLMLIDVITDPRKLKLDDEITDWFLGRFETSAKPRIEAILRQAPLRPGITVEALKAAIVKQPRLREALGIIIETHCGMDAPGE